MDRSIELFNLMKWSNDNSMVFGLKNKNKFEHKNIKQHFNTWK
jgi:hypothetical protein